MRNHLRMGECSYLHMRDISLAAMWVIERDMKQDWIQWVITATQQTVIKHLQHAKHKTNREIKYVIESPQQFHKVGKKYPHYTKQNTGV